MLTRRASNEAFLSTHRLTAYATKSMATALISLGSNLGDRKATLDAAVENLRQTAGISQVVVSSYHATKPVGGPEGQEDFLNAAARLDTSLSPRELLTELQRIERELGRVRQEHWGPRTLDLDLLLYDNLVINEPDLIVPHRFLAFRRFVLKPAVEVAGEMVHPTLERTLSNALQYIEGAPRVFEVGGLTPSVRMEFATRVADLLGLAILKRQRQFLDGRSEKFMLEKFFRMPDGTPRSPQTTNYIAEDWYVQLCCWRQPPPHDLPRWCKSTLRCMKTYQEKWHFMPVPLFLLDAPTAWIVGGDRQVALLGHDAEIYCGWFREVIAYQMKKNYAPTLLLPADDLDRAVREAVAAIQSMQ